MKTTKRTKVKITKSALADALGISRQALNVHLKSPDAPQIDDITGWQVFIAAHGREGTAPPDIRRAIAEERLEILKETKVKLARENEVEAGKMLRADDVVRQCAQAAAFFAESLDKLCRELPPLLSGQPAVAIATKMESEVENIRRHLKIKLALIK